MALTGDKASNRSSNFQKPKYARTLFENTTATSAAHRRHVFTAHALPSPVNDHPSPHRPISDDDNLAPSSPPSPAKPEPSSEPTPPATRTPAFPSREDCWSEEATRTLIEAWGAHYLQLNRGNLRQKHWQEVADAVNAIHATSAKLRRTDVQCKNRIDTTKKKYKIEKSKVVQSNGRYVSTWPHFQSLDSLIGDSFSKTSNNTNGHNRNLRRRASPSPELSPSPPPLAETIIQHRKSSPVIHDPERDPAMSHLLRLPWSVPVGPRSKRSGPGSVTERNFSVMAAAAAAMEAEEDEEDDDDDEDSGAWGGRLPSVGRKRKVPLEEEETMVGDGYRRLAEAITRLAKIYEKVEEAKQRQMVELEKQRMQFAKDLEIQRMKVFMESQVQLEKLKRAKQFGNGKC
ncbi:UNVERIFIED_CONTAM: Trihelix transcription factor ASIL2 [Sesamum latifolium]|uniref:Trihelix transcription factor ASIL2 n=1 Tax=Sesamum latifolium TaxID=2727402 RepID=A0AAW2WQP3_9LAMI